MPAVQYAGNLFGGVPTAQQVFDQRPKRALLCQPGRATGRARELGGPSLRDRRTVAAGNARTAAFPGLRRRVPPAVTLQLTTDRARQPCSRLTWIRVRVSLLKCVLFVPRATLYFPVGVALQI